MNPFLSTRHLTNSEEDHLTEFFAAALETSAEFRKAYADVAISAYAAKMGWPAPIITTVTTQVFFDGPDCMPDMKLVLADGHSVICEHKLDAVETMGKEEDPRKQLERYVDLPVDGVLYVRSLPKPPTNRVLVHPKYIRPLTREHYLWRDFYPCLALGGGDVVRWLKEGFERLGFTPPHPTVGDMMAEDHETRRANRRNFAKMWGMTRATATGRGWKVKPGAIVALTFKEGKSHLASRVYISPAQPDRFLIRATPRSGKLDALLAAMSTAAALLDPMVEVTATWIPRQDGKAQVVDVYSTLNDVIGAKTTDCDEIEQRLHHFVSAFLNVL